MHRPAPSAGKGAGGTFTLPEADADTLVFYEVYRDAATGRKHPTTPHFAKMMARLQELMAAPIELQLLEIVAEK
jgi:quinol monooxygenase YgiN